MKRLCTITLVCFLCMGGIAALSAQEKSKTKGLVTSEVSSFKKGELDKRKDNQWALIIGINSYEHITSLNNARFDAGAIKKLLVERYAFPPKKVKYLKDGDADIRPIKTQLKWFQDNLKARDSLFIFFSGHGFVEEDIGYWLPSNVGGDRPAEAGKIKRDRRLSENEKSLRIAALSEWKLSYYHIVNFLSLCRAKHIFLVMDACYSAKILREFREGSGVSRNRTILGSRKLLASGRGLVSDGAPGTHSPFAQYIINILEENSNSYIRASSLIQDAKRRGIGEGGFILNTGGKKGEFYFFMENTYLKWVQDTGPKLEALESFLVTNSPLRQKEARCNDFLQELEGAPDTRYFRQIKESIRNRLETLWARIAEVEQTQREYKLNKAREKKNAGKAAYRQREYEKAKGLFREALDWEPGNTEAQLYLAKIGEWLRAPRLTPASFLQYRRDNPESAILEDMKEHLYKAFPLLPPENYLEHLTTKNLDGKGYWEVRIQGHEMVFIPPEGKGRGGFFIDKYEVSIAMLKTVVPDPPVPVGSGDAFPAVTGIGGANRYCRAKGFRLPAKKEWEYAAGGAYGYDYPWGKNPVDEGGEYRANYGDVRFEGDKKEMVFKDGYKYLAPVKSFEAYPSPFGLVNMAGNVWEWVEGGKCKGGGFMSGKEHLKISVTSVNESMVGFRCIMDVK